jgi:hypothetical protein
MQVNQLPTRTAERCHSNLIEFYNILPVYSMLNKALLFFLSKQNLRGAIDMNSNSRMLTVSGVYPNSSLNPVPAVRVQGKWLEDIGFCVGCKVKIYESVGEITIKLAESPENEGNAESKSNKKDSHKSKQQPRNKVVYSSDKSNKRASS